MPEYTKLVIFSTDAEQVAQLKLRFQADPHISVVLGNGIETTRNFELDALWLTPMQAHHYGVTDHLPFEEARVFPMPDEIRAKGLPRLLIAGVSLDPAKEYASQFLSQIAAAALANAIKSYNTRTVKPILRVGSVPENLCLARPQALEAGKALKVAFHALLARSESEQVSPQRILARS